MDKRDANIDLVFRNGLKDYEVLPPSGLWEKIEPSIEAPRKKFVFLRAAAALAAVISVSFFVYKLGNTPSAVFENLPVAVDQIVYSPVSAEPLALAPLGKTAKSEIQNERKAILVTSVNIDPLVVKEEMVPVIAPIRDLESLSVKRTSLFSPSVNEIPVIQKANLGLTIPVDESHLIDVSTLKSDNRWSISALASPSYYSKFATGNTDLAKQLMGTEKNLLSYSGGVSFVYKVNKKFSIQSGISYSSIGQMVEDILSFGGFQKYDYTKGDRNFELITSSGLIYTNNSDVYLMGYGNNDRFVTSVSSDIFDPGKAQLKYLNGNLRQNISYLEVPVLMRYKFLDRTVDLNLIGGFSYNMLIKNTVSTLIDGEKYIIGKTDGLNAISVSSSFGMGMEYSISDKMTFNVEPTIRYYINPFSQSGGMKIHPYSLGLFSGISYWF